MRNFAIHQGYGTSSSQLIFILLSIFLFSVACRSDQKPSIKEGVIWHEIYTDYTSSFGYINAIKFEDDSIYEFDALKGFMAIGTYEFRGDSLDINYGTEPWVVAIQVSGDSLKLTDSVGEYLYIQDGLRYNPSLSFSKIVLETGGCYGECAEFTAVFTKTGAFNYDGREFSTLKGKHSYELTPEQLLSIDSLYKRSFYDRFDENIYYGSADGWEMELIVQKNGETKRIRGTYYSFPYPLFLLVDNLVSIVDRKISESKNKDQPD
ncbi:DUF6438 domain-containing protein [Cesiribacter andamanensis]|uniref:DUF6438 domain-containing protein n=1 Tax=Cesiribacter andamanensis AMV16 TaxID=1279009 RepID=M7NBS4_9BACT|nr:DUF6438 domain-containing protein [Cesiribacter andamanensis]EMR04636.1 hypothetical protein ADICEAN_00239 [Cesiribacter andamanensis AMV16]